MRREVTLNDKDAVLPYIEGHNLPSGGYKKQCKLVGVIFGVAITGCVVSLLGAGTVMMILKRKNERRRQMEEMVKEEIARAKVREQRWEPMRGRRDSEEGASRMKV